MCSHVYMYVCTSAHAYEELNQMAWQFDNQRNPTVGYKLAFNLLKVSE